MSEFIDSPDVNSIQQTSPTDTDATPNATEHQSTTVSTRIVHARRQSSVDQDTAAKLERRLSERPQKTELVDRNILKDDSVAPALQAAKERLQRSQLEDKLASALQQRPKPEELVKEGILQEDEVTTITTAGTA